MAHATSPPIPPADGAQIPRRERERLARRQDILQAALQVFAERGYRTATLDDVALRAEFGKGTLYNYFGSKEDLFRSVLEDAFGTMMQVAREALEAEVSFEEKIGGFTRGLLAYFFRNLETMTLVMREAHHLQNGNPLMHLMPQLIGMVAATIAAEQKRRSTKMPGEPMELATILFSMVFGQFNSRIYRSLANGAEINCASLTGIFGELNEQEITEQVEQATRLTRSVFLHGITSPQPS